jgi:PhoH-like ATPase
MNTKLGHLPTHNRFTKHPRGGHQKIKPTKKVSKKKVSKPKVMVLDTNVLIDDPEAINQFGNNFVVIPITVVRELDRNKGKLFSARHALKALDASEANDDFKPLKNGGKIKIEMVPERPDQLNDDVIISIALSYKTKGFGAVVFVTNDRAAAIKAKSLGIVTENYKTNEVDLDLLRDKKRAQGFSEIEKGIVYENNVVKPYVPEYWKKKGVKNNLAQEKAIQDLFDTSKTFVVLEGQAGTGKTMLAILAALGVVKKGFYKKIIITKPVIAVGGNDIGFLPGTKEAKMDPWIAPIRDHINNHFTNKSESSLVPAKKRVKPSLDSEEKNQTPFDRLLSSGVIEIEAETFIRGRSFEGVIVIIDEAQNLAVSGAKTWMTRMGDGSKLVMTGDVTQIDTPYLSKNNNALAHSAVKTDGQIWASTVFLDLGVRSVMSDWAANNL